MTPAVHSIVEAPGCGRTKPRRRRFCARGVVALAVLAGTFLTTAAHAQAPPDSSIALSAAALEDHMTRVVESVLPSLVAVIGEWPRDAAGDLGAAERQRPKRVSVSSGFAIPGGYIVTTQTVARNATSFRIKPYRQPERVARLVAVDAVSRLCVLRAADTTGLQPVRLAAAETPLRVGSWVFVAGTTGLTDVNTSFGTITHVPAATDDPEAHYMAVSAAVAAGASGSAVLNSRGEVIGVALATIVTPGEGASLDAPAGGAPTNRVLATGTSLALPLDVLQSVATMVHDTGTVSRGYLGVQWNPDGDADSTIATSVPQGAHIWDVVAGGPAYEAHLRKGDIVTYCNGAVVTSGPALQAMIQRLPAGAVARLTVMREGQPFTIAVHLGTLPSPAGPINIPGRVEPEGSPTAPSPDDSSSR